MNWKERVRNGEVVSFVSEKNLMEVRKGKTENITVFWNGRGIRNFSKLGKVCVEFIEKKISFHEMWILK